MQSSTSSSRQQTYDMQQRGPRAILCAEQNDSGERSNDSGERSNDVYYAR